jgi:hypothetical protein
MLRLTTHERAPSQAHAAAAIMLFCSFAFETPKAPYWMMKAHSATAKTNPVGPPSGTPCQPTFVPTSLVLSKLDLIASRQECPKPAITRCPGHGRRPGSSGQAASGGA